MKCAVAIHILAPVSGVVEIYADSLEQAVATVSADIDEHGFGSKYWLGGGSYDVDYSSAEDIWVGDTALEILE